MTFRQLWKHLGYFWFQHPVTLTISYDFFNLVDRVNVLWSILIIYRWKPSQIFKASLLCCLCWIFHYGGVFIYLSKAVQISSKQVRSTIPNLCLALIPSIKLFLMLSSTSQNLESSDFPDIIPQLRPLMHTICLVYSNSTFYNSPARIIVLMTETCNLLIGIGRKYLDPGAIFQVSLSSKRGAVAINLF